MVNFANLKSLSKYHSDENAFKNAFKNLDSSSSIKTIFSCNKHSIFIILILLGKVSKYNFLLFNNLISSFIKTIFIIEIVSYKSYKMTG